MQSRRRISSLYNLALRYFVKHESFDERVLDCIPGNVKDDIMRIALLRGKGRDHVSYFLHSNISKLIINECRISETDLENISRCGRLRVLEMNPARHYRYNHRTVTLERMFCGLRHLVRLHIERNDGMTDDVVVTMTTNCQGLQELNVGGCVTLTDRAVQAISSLACLRALDLSATRLTDTGLAAVASGPCSRTLVELGLNKCLAVTDVGINVLIGTCKSITILEFCDCPNVKMDNQTALSNIWPEDKPTKVVVYTVY